MESWDWTNVICLGTIFYFVSLHGTENNFWIFVCGRHTFIFWLEVHARPAIGCPKINNYSCVSLNQVWQMSLRLDFCDFTNFWLSKRLLLLLLRLSTGTTHVAESTTTKLVHHILHSLGIHTSHSRHTSWHLRLLGWLALSLCLISNIILKNRVRPLHKIILHTRQHRSELFSKRCVHKSLWQVNNVLWDSSS